MSNSTKIEFFKYFPIVKRQIVDYMKSQLTNHPPRSTIDWLEKVLDYNVPRGKLNRGLMLVETFRNLTGERQPADISSVCKIGWAVELLQSSFIVADDIMDASLTRRGQPCWYKLPEIGMKAVNDSLLLENCVDLLLRQELNDKACYANVTKAFQEAKLATILGQHLDSSRLPLVDCTESYYSDVVRLKTSHYTFLLPIMVAVHLSVDEKSIDENELRHLCFKLGHYFQAQDDFLDCFGDPNVTGKIGTDIRDSKCSWLLVEAMKILKENRQEDFLELDANYGKNENSNVEAVKKLFERLGMVDKYEQFEKTAYKDIETLIDNLSLTKLQAQFRQILIDLHKRKK